MKQSSFAEFARLLSAVVSRLFETRDSREFKRLKDFITS